MSQGKRYDRKGQNKVINWTLHNNNNNNNLETMELIPIWCTALKQATQIIFGNFGKKLNVISFHIESLK